MTQQALAGLKIVDFSWYIAGPSITMWLAHHGATVIRIESMTHPDEMRSIEPFKDKKPGVNRSGAYANYNSNKYGFSLNLNHPRGVSVAQRMVAWADIIVENFTPGTMEKRWGLGYESARKINPSIVMLSSSTQGQTGPDAKQAGFGLELASRSGFTNFVGWPDQDAVGVGYPYTDTATPPVGVVAIMAALELRQRTGKGQYIDLSQLEVGVQHLTPAILDFTINQRRDGRIGNRHRNAAPHGAFRCRGDDRWCAIAVFTEPEWQAFCGVIGQPQMADDPRFATLPQRKRNEDNLEIIVNDWTQQFPPVEVMKRMQAAGVAAGMINNGKDLLEDPQLAYRHHFWYLDHPEMGKCVYDGPPFKLSATPAELSMPAPMIGEHNEYVCTKLLGMSDEEFVGLLAEGVFE